MQKLYLFYLLYAQYKIEARRVKYPPLNELCALYASIMPFFNCFAEKIVLQKYEKNGERQIFFNEKWAESIFVLCHNFALRNS